MSIGYTTVGPNLMTDIGLSGFDAVFPVQPQYPHNFVGVVLCDEEGNPTGENLAGTLTVSVETVVTPGVFQVIGTINTAAPEDLSFAANAVNVKVASDDPIVDATGLRVMITQNMS